ncbi:ubiquitin-conjugating enzyme/RWD-like protein, partial [Halteromyces radiatus]|uniref:ubiquitin-conjugating enzyme/RWD-like protein n=1 Tax=Halteromyces radiatus TaxID=101107 RepID=UPI0022203583
NYQDLTEIQAWIRGPDDTPYENGYFKIRLLLNQGFPTQPPKGYFNTKIFHPNISSTGEICVNTLKKDWKSDVGIGHILLTIKCLLIVPNAESALNEEAGKLLLEQYEDYAKRARLYTKIHAKAGKTEYQQLCQQFPQNTTSNSSSSNTNNKDISTLSSNEKPSASSLNSESSDKQQSQNSTTITNGGNILTPSMVSNGVMMPTPGELKRPATSDANPKTVKHLRTDENVTTVTATASMPTTPSIKTQKAALPSTKDKKKRGLRRL